MIDDYNDLIRELLSNDRDRKCKACKHAAAAIRQLMDRLQQQEAALHAEIAAKGRAETRARSAEVERDEATCLLAQTRSEADGQRSRAEVAESGLAAARAALLWARTVTPDDDETNEHAPAIAAARAEGGE